ncbi:MAG: tetratricopeptide repeat protein [Burkholderiales bacterium]|nr:tetratricopeptide repeat protein [Burkholderiales bacterium]
MTDLARAQQLFFAALEAQNEGRYPDAERLYRETLLLAPDRPSVLNNLATVLQQQNRLPEALDCCERLLATADPDAAAWSTIGNVRLALGQTAAALECYDRGLAKDPHRIEILLNRGNTLGDLRRYDEAIADYRLALAADPQNLDVLVNLGHALLESGRPQDALDTCEKALAINGGCVAALRNAGSALAALGRLDAALRMLLRARELEPGNSSILCQAGNVLLRLQRPQEALACCEQAIALDDSHADAYQNRGNAKVALARYEEALKDFARAQQLAPGAARPYWNESLCRLLLGDFEQGWTHYARGWEIGQRGQRRYSQSKPEWDGRPLDGTLLAWGEQGIGDQILHASMLDDLRPLVRRLVVAVDPRLVMLYRRSMPGIEFVSMEESETLDDHDAQVAMGDLGKWLRRSERAFPVRRKAFLRADPNRAARLRERLSPAQAFLCGVSWRSANPAIGELKSLPLSGLAPLLELRNLRCVDLQYGDTRAEREALRAERGMEVAHVDDLDNFHDIDGLAALIEACDVVVTVSNTTAHLSGALGKKTLVLLPYALGRIWYWHEGRDSSPWYPDCRLIRQTAAGEWAPVIDRAAAEVAKEMSVKTKGGA